MGKSVMLKIMATLCAFLFFMGIAGAYAVWIYPGDPLPSEQKVDIGLEEFVYAPKEILHITAIELDSTSNASNLHVSFKHPTHISSSIQGRERNGSVTYKVTLYNNTGVTYWYLGLTWDDAVDSNSLLGVSNGVTITTKDYVTDSGNTFNTGDWVPPYTTRDIYVTYQCGRNAVGVGIATQIDLKFGVKMDSVHDEFCAILNDTISANGYHYLDEVFNQRYKETGSTSIANVGDDKEIFDNLFGGTPTININGVEVPVTMMIQRENVDNRDTGDEYGVNGGPTGCEYTLYITIDAMDSPTGEAMVYAISYSRGGEGDTDQWYQLGQLYEGTAPLVTYDDKGNVAFDIDKWRATANEYEFIDGYYYKVGYEQGDQYAKYKTIEELMSANDQNFYNDIDNSGLLRKVYGVLYKSGNNSGRPGYEGLHTAFVNAAPFYTIHNNGQEVKIKRAATRAELLPYIVAIQKAYDYYSQVNNL